METVEILHIEKEVLTVSREIWYNDFEKVGNA